MKKVNEIFKEIEDIINSDISPARIAANKKFFKEEIKSAGWELPKVRSLGKEYAKRLQKEQYEFEQVLVLAEKLFKTEKIEQATLGLEILTHYYKSYTPELFPTFAKWTNYLTNWAITDDFAMHHIAKVLALDSSLFKELLKWTKSDSRWIRRSALVSLKPEAAKGNKLKEVFTMCDKLMKDDDEMVQKAVGWLLKEASKKHPQEIAVFLLEWKPKISRKVLYAACQKMPAGLKQKILETS
jgi:3-methyladenine DNA glycosylase AlkD